MATSHRTDRLDGNLGRRLREVRLERGVTQAEVARRLGVSAAYLNLIEKGRRTLPLALLWRALELLGVEPEPFIESLAAQPVQQNLAQLLDEPLLRTLDLDADDVASLSAEPRAVTTITALFNLYKNARGQLDHVVRQVSRREAARKVRAEAGGKTFDESMLGFDYSPLDEVTDFLQRHANHFPEIEELSRRMRREAGLERRVLSDQLVEMLRDRLDVDVETVELPSSVVRRYDAEAGRVSLSASLTEARRKFDLAHVAGLRLLDRHHLHESILGATSPKHPETPTLLKIHLANYFAGALLMPYEDFFAQAQATRYDVERLAGQFEMSYEAAAHRLTNLAAPRSRGVPFHFLRVDLGGNISKRYSATGLRFPSQLGSCSKWVVHTAFLTPSIIGRQFSVMPDGTAYFCFAKVVTAPIGGSLVRGTVYSIGMGAHAEDARHLAYADDQPRWIRERAPKVGVPVGTTCRFCERTDCNQRAQPSYKFAFTADEHVKKDNFFSPILDRELLRGRRGER